MAFTGYPSDTLAFLDELRTSTDTGALAADGRYPGVLAASRELVVDCGEVLARLEPTVRAEPRLDGSIVRLHRDMRFTRSPRRYKEHLELLFWEGDRARALSTFFMRIGAEHVCIGAGARRLAGPDLHAFRAAVADPTSGAELAGIVARLERKGIAIGAEGFVRTPRGLTTDGPGARFVRYDRLVAATAHDRGIIHDRRALLGACRKTWRAVAPLHDWLRDEVEAHRPDTAAAG